MNEEWFNDGFTMEEQAEFRRNAIRGKLTEKFKAESADKLIKDLQTKLGQSESYIQELEHDKKLMQNEINNLRNAKKEIMDKYSLDISKLHSDNPLLHNKIQELKDEVKELKSIRDHLLFKLSQYERNNKEMV